MASDCIDWATGGIAVAAKAALSFNATLAESSLESNWSRSKNEMREDTFDGLLTTGKTSFSSCSRTAVVEHFVSSSSISFKNYYC